MAGFFPKLRWICWRSVFWPVRPGSRLGVGTSVLGPRGVSVVGMADRLLLAPYRTGVVPGAHAGDPRDTVSSDGRCLAGLDAFDREGTSHDGRDAGRLLPLFRSAVPGAGRLWYESFWLSALCRWHADGPYAHPRAAAPFSRFVLPVMMLGCAWLVAGSGRSGSVSEKTSRLRAFLSMSLLAVGVVALMVLAGQRIPMALTILGIAVCAVFYRPLRPAALVAVFSLPVLILLAHLFAPQAFQHLVILAAHQLSHFWQSHYGLVFTRAVVIAQGHPVTGLGYDAFRHACANPAYQHGLSWLSTAQDGGGAGICVQHAHNHYLQALTNAGLPGLFLFGGMVFGCLRALWPVKGAHQAWRIGLFAAFFVQEWPLASASDFLNLPLGGWAFTLLGVGLAEAVACVASVPRPAATLYAEPTTTSR